VQRTVAAWGDSPELHDLFEELAALKQSLVASFRVYLRSPSGDDWYKPLVEQ
jgi:hypothetical protein